jgi:hypothetical protein
MAIEVKRVENLNLSAWWSQAVRQAGNDLIPVLAYRQSRKPWAIVIPLAWLTGLPFPITAIATISLEDFCRLVEARQYESKANTKLDSKVLRENHPANRQN